MTEKLRIHKHVENLSGSLPDDHTEEVDPAPRIEVVIILKKDRISPKWNLSPNSSFGWDGDL